MQFEKDLKSEFKDLFLQAREILLSYEGIMELVYVYVQKGVINSSCYQCVD